MKPKKKNDNQEHIVKARKADVAEVKAIDDKERIVEAVISTDAVDRDKEVLKPSGVQLEEFQKNPVVLWSHNAFQPPIAKAIEIKKSAKRIVAKLKFAATEFAEEIYQLYKQGFLKAFSVGFMPIKGHAPTPEEIKKRPELAEARWIYDKWTLLEFSPVTVPANPEALALAVKSKLVNLSEPLTSAFDFLQDSEEEIYDFTDGTEIRTITTNTSTGGDYGSGTYYGGNYNGTQIDIVKVEDEPEEKETEPIDLQPVKEDVELIPVKEEKRSFNIDEMLLETLKLRKGIVYS